MPSKLEILRRLALSQKGAYGAQRVERAADEIKNLTKLYSPKALDAAFLGDNAKALMTMNPKDFERYAAPLMTRKPTDIGKVDAEFLKRNPTLLATDDYIKYLQKVKGGFNDVPFLEINKEEQGSTYLPYISGHEGRHRNRAMAASGEQAGLIRLEPRAELREPFPRRSQEEYIEALRQELGMTGNMVKPEPIYEGRTRIERPEIELPPIYKKGGAVSQDAMRLAVMNQKVQHKVKGGRMGAGLEVLKGVGNAIKGSGKPVISDKFNLINLDTRNIARDLGIEARIAKQRAVEAEGRRKEAAKIVQPTVGYRQSTPLKPDPLEGQRYVAAKPTGIITPPMFDPSKHIGANTSLLDWDSITRNSKVSGVSGYDLPVEITTPGGYQYALDEGHIAKGVAGASGKEIAKRVADRINISSAEGANKGGTGEALSFVQTMGGGAENFSSPIPQLMFDMVNHRLMEGRITKADADYITKLIKTRNPKVFGDTSQFAGFNDMGWEQFHTGEGLTGTSPGALRTAISDVAQMESVQKLLDFNIADFKNAIIADKLRDVPKGNIGSVVIRAPDRGVEVIPNPLFPYESPYSTNFTGTGIAQFPEMMNSEALFYRALNPIKEELLEKGAKIPYTAETLHRAALGALGKRKENISQMIDPQFVDDYGTYLDELSKPNEYKDGGVVHMKDGNLVDELINEAKKKQQAPVNPFRMPTEKQSQYEKDIRQNMANQQEARERLFSDRIPSSVGEAKDKAIGLLQGAGGALAGYGSQVAGGFGDVASLYQEFKPESFPDLPAKVQALPTTEDIQDLLREHVNPSPEFSAGISGGNAAALIQGAASLPALARGAAKGATAGSKALANEAAYRIHQAVMNGEGILAAPLSGIAPRRIFIGEKSAFYDNGGERVAKVMEAAGKTPEDIWMQTKTFRGADGKWRQERSDKDAKFFDAAAIKGKADAAKEFELAIKQKIEDSKAHPDLFPKQLTQAQKELRGQAKASKSSRESTYGLQADPELQGNSLDIALEHPTLYEAYPELRKVVVNQGGYGGDTLGQLTHAGGDFAMDIFDAGLKKDPRSTALHEAQHAIQAIEGWSPGGSSRMAFQNKEAFDILKDMREKAKIPLPFDVYAKDGGWDNPQSAQRDYEKYVKGLKTISPANDRVLQGEAAKMYYKRLAGETEARAVQDRMDFTDAQLAERPPSTDYEFQIDDQIVKPPFKMAGGGKVGALKALGEIFVGGAKVKVRPPSDNVANVRNANFQYPRTIGNQNVSIGDLKGGVRFDNAETQRVNQLAAKIASPEGYISRIIVDHDNNVVEGQHRLEALRQLGAKEVPVYKIEDLADTMPVAKMESAIKSIGAIHSDHVHQLMQHVLNDIAEHGIEGARQMDAGAFQKFYDAALDAASRKAPQEDALRLAQERAALPVDQGGLGLPAGNTAEQRADVMFPESGFHATGADITKVDPVYGGKNDYGTIGQGFYVDPSKDAGYSNLIAEILSDGGVQRIMPLRYDASKLYDATDLLAIRSAESSKKATENIKNAGYSGTFSRNSQTQLPNEVAIFDPDVIRSRFAAFDPFRRNAAIAASMGVAAPDLLAAEPEKKAKGGPVSLDAMRLALQNKKVQHKAGGGKMEALRAIGRGYKGMREPVKPKSITKEGGGNWLAGSVEGAMKPLKRSQMSPEDMALAEKLSQGTWNPELAATQKRRIEESTRNAPLNQFIDKQLTRYVKNQMATKEDPIRALAEKGTLHVNPEQLNFNPFTYGKYLSAGQKVVAQSPTAKSWEGVSDLSISPMIAKQLLGNDGTRMGRGDSILENNPWLNKVPEETSVYSMTDPQGVPSDLGFDHLIDELRNATNPASGLPRELLIKPESLSKLSVPQAVERVAKINEWRAAQKAEADVVRANNAATVMHKEYPDKGYSWKELRLAEAEMPEGAIWEEYGGNHRLFGPNGESLSIGATKDEAMRLLNREERKAQLEDALKYEGETMGHCVGGYCPDVMEGRSRIYSLRDAKGQPHVTIEETPHRGWFDKAFKMPDPSGQHRSFHELIDDERGRLAKQKGGYGAIDENYEDTANRLASQYQLEAKPAIAQIKGKGNKAPNAEYLPFVQDFVKSGKWSDVGDFHNTGLMRIAPESNEALYLQRQNKPIPEYVSDQEYEEIRRGMADAMRSPYGAADEMKEGGVAHLDKGGAPETPEQELQRFLRMLRINASGGKDQYGSSVGGRFGLNIPVSENVSIEPYVQGFAFKPDSGKLINGGVGGANLNIRFNNGGKVSQDAMRDEGMKEGDVAHLSAGGFLKKLLPMAEREANLKKFRELSKAPMRLYHGTTATEGGKGEEAVRILKPSKEGALGSGAYLTPNPKFAGEYTFPKDISDAARASIQSGIDNKEIFRRGSGNILPVYAQLKNPLILEGIKPPGAMYSGDPMIEALKKLGIDEDKASNMVEKAYENRGYIGKQVQSRAQAQGYDGIMQYRDGELMEVLPFSSNQVKSAIGNEGTYDIYSPELNKAKGGSVSMDAMRLAVMNKQLRKHHG